MGRVFDSKPVHMELEAGKTYGWCTCGHSNKQVTRLLASMQKLMCIGIVTLLVVFSGHCFKKIQETSHLATGRMIVKGLSTEFNKF